MHGKKRSSLNKIEQKIYDILIALNVKFEPHVEIDKYNVDFVVNDQYIIECYGDFWHSNPNKYAPSYFNKGKKKTAQDIWNRDAERKRTFEEMGYRFLHLWESDINDDIKRVRSKLKRYLRE